MLVNQWQFKSLPKWVLLNNGTYYNYCQSIWMWLWIHIWTRYITEVCVGPWNNTVLIYIYIYMQPCCSWMFEQWLLLIPFVVGRMTGPWLHPKWVIHRTCSTASSFNLQYLVRYKIMYILVLLWSYCGTVILSYF